ncbi:MAG: pilus assembly protein [Erythrobacter sp.]|nr:pilus assembly protein [Erythrobacter sp.]
MKTVSLCQRRTLGALGKSLKRNLARLPRRFARDQSGVAMIEFAFTAPLILGLGMMGTETAYFVITHMQVSQIAMQVADSTSRVGETDVLTARRVFDSDINESFVGAEKLGENINIFDRGRVIVSSLQQNADGGQWIAWQRCRGAKVHDSTFGEEGDGATGTGFPGMGETGREITAAQGTAVMFVEVSYDYRSLTPFDIFDAREISYTAAFNVRDSRDLSQLHESGAQALCDQYSADRP